MSVPVNVKQTEVLFGITPAGEPAYDRIRKVTLDLSVACPICGRSLTYDEQRTAPLVYTDTICSEPTEGRESCMTWLGRNLVRWMGNDHTPLDIDFNA